MQKTQKHKLPYTDNRQIGQQLNIGDRQIIAAKLNVSYSLVKMTLLGYRNNQRVLTTAQELIDHKRQFLTQ